MFVGLGVTGNFGMEGVGEGVAGGDGSDGCLLWRLGS